MFTKILLLFLLLSPVSNLSDTELFYFLESDSTDMLVYNETFDCTLFTYTLINNAHKENINMGGLLMFNSSLRGHVMAYVYVDGIPMYIESQTDDIFTFNQVQEIYNRDFYISIPSRLYYTHYVTDYYLERLLCSDG